mgnify:CR=1 FL=1
MLGEFAQDMILVNFEKKLNKLGFKTEFNDDIIIYANNTKLVLTDDIYRNVEEGNINYINQIASSVRQFKSYTKKGAILTDKLVNHFSSHQNRTMTTGRLVTWKSDLKKAKNIYNKIHSLKGNNLENTINFYKHIDNKTLDEYNDFWQIVRGSGEVLGM